jgi:hypothetical protein
MNPVPSFAASLSARVVRTEEITVTDVLCGRGGDINVHVGNEHYRNIIESNRVEYLTSKYKREKRSIATRVVDTIHNLSPPGRFLSKIQHHGRKRGRSKGPDLGWVEIEYEKAIEKASQALRENAPSIRKQIGRQGQSSAEDNEDSDTPENYRTAARQAIGGPPFHTGNLQRLPSGAIQQTPSTGHHSLQSGQQLPTGTTLHRLTSGAIQQVPPGANHGLPSLGYQQFPSDAIQQLLSDDLHRMPSGAIQHLSMGYPQQLLQSFPLENASQQGSMQQFPHAQGSSLSSMAAGPLSPYTGFWAADATSSQSFQNAYLGLPSSQPWDASGNITRVSTQESPPVNFPQTYNSSLYHRHSVLHSSTSGSGQSSFDMQDRAAQGMVSLAMSQYQSANSGSNIIGGTRVLSSSNNDNNNKRIKLSSSNQSVPLSPIRILRDGVQAASPPHQPLLPRSSTSAAMGHQNNQYFPYPNHPMQAHGADYCSLFHIPSLAVVEAMSTSQEAIGNRGESRHLTSHHHHHTMESPTHASIEDCNNSLESHSL